MTLDFTVKEFILGGGTGTPTFQFYRRGFNLGGSGSSPEWKDIILKGVTALTLVNSKADGLNYLKLFGGTEQLPETYIDSVTLEGKCEQNGTPTPNNPVDIVCNNGTIKYSANMANVNAQTVLVGYYISNTGVVTADIYNWLYQNYIPVKPNTTYTLSMSSSVYYVSISEYSTADDSGFVIRKVGSAGSNTKLTITTEATTNYVRFGTNINRTAVTLDTVLAIDWMLNVGNSLPYTPYVEGGIYIDGTQEVVTDSLGNTAIAENLLSVGDYKDTQEVLTGVVTRNVRIKAFDGTEVWGKISGYNIYYTPISDMLYCNPTQVGFSNQFVGSSAPNANMPNYSTKFTYTTDMTGAVSFRYNAITTIEDWQQFLADRYNAGNPVIVVYPLATATTETVTGQFLSKEPATVTGSLTGLVANVVSSSHTTPTPQQPLPINTNNGVVKVSPNLFNKNSYTEINAYVNSSTGVLTQGSPGGTTQYCAVIPCLPNTTYTISGRASSAWGAFTSSNIGTTATSFNRTENGSITTGANDKYLIGLVRANQNVIDYRNTLQVELGSTATPYMPYGQVYIDGTEETVQVHGINIFDKNDTENIGGWYSSSNQTITQANANETLVMRAKPNTTYYFKHCSVKGGCRAFYTEVEDWEIGSACSNMSGNAGANANVVYSITTSANAKWIFFNCGRNNVEASFDDQRNDFMVSTSELTSDTPYEPYFNGGTATAEMLLKIGDYQDEQNVTTGQVTRNVRLIVLDGTEAWSKRTDTGTNRYQANILTNKASGAISCLCSHFKNVTSFANLNDNCFIADATTRIIFCEEDITALADWKAFLTNQYNAGTPVIVIYQLAESTTETVTAQPLTIQAGTNVVEITEASMDNLELEVSYKAGVEVTVIEIENAQLDNSVEVTVNG